ENDEMGDSLNDAIFSGSYSGSEIGEILFVSISSEGNPDTFNYEADMNSSCYGEDISITGEAQYLCDGIYITFENTTGHSLGDEWAYFMAPDEESFSNTNLFSITGPEGISFLKITPLNTFIGTDAGLDSSQVWDSTFFGFNAGRESSDVSGSYFFGEDAGSGTTVISSSNFFGYQAGSGATEVQGSNFFGINAGSDTSAFNSNFFGRRAGEGATNAYDSVFLGTGTGQFAEGAANSIFIGKRAGRLDMVDNTYDTNMSDDNWSILIGYNTNTGGFKNSILLGGSTSSTPISNTKANQFMLAPSVTEMRLRGIDYTLPASQGGASTVLTNNGGGELLWEKTPISIVATRGLSSLSLDAGSANESIFLGAEAGYQATGAEFSYFLGIHAGYQANNAPYSSFIGSGAGEWATNSGLSVFIGSSAGSGATNAQNSIFIGRRAGNADTVNNTGNADDFSILVGSNTSTGGFSNSIALGGSATNTATNQLMIGSATRPINTTIWVGATGTTTLDTSTGLISTSDERLKTNIEDLPSDTLDKLLNIKTVTFNWLNGNNDQTNIGFIAQDLEQYFPELVYTGNDENNYKGINYANMTPVLVEAIRELDLKLSNFDDLEEENSWRDSFVSWFGNVTNEIREFVAGTLRARNQICIGEGDEEVCITKEDLLRMKNGTEESTEDTNEFIVEDENNNDSEDDIIPVVEDDKQDDEKETGESEVEADSSDDEDATEREETASGQDNENTDIQNDGSQQDNDTPDENETGESESDVGSSNEDEKEGTTNEGQATE
ncbi:MAG: tail fiber domain-containing protein, partial [Candidatus Pacebacteria bacterium]|nr:tail fiber domain-containing protein [Candidatus Paceibacterota bacterium]